MYDEDRDLRENIERYSKEQRSDARLVEIVAYITLAAAIFNFGAIYWIWHFIVMKVL